MNPREKKMAILLGAFILVGGGGFFLYQFVYQPWQQAEANKARLTEDIHKSTLELAKKNRDLKNLANWRMMSLPADPMDARREYGHYLEQMLERSGWTITDFSPGLAEVKAGPPVSTANKTPLYTSLTFTVKGQAAENSIVQFLEEFAKAPVMHKIRSLTVTKPVKRETGGGDQKGGDQKGKGKGKGAFGGMDFAKGGMGAFGGGKKGGFGGFGKDAAGGFGKGGFGGKGVVGRGERLPVTLQVEALIIGGPAKHWTNLSGLDERLVVADLITGLRGGPIGLAQVPWVASPQGARPPQRLAKAPVPRNYTDIARARLFDGPVVEVAEKDRTRPKTEYSDVAKFVKLIRITGYTTAQGSMREAELLNLLQPMDSTGRGPDRSRIRLRDVDEGGYKKFIIRDDDDEEILRGEVLRVTAREVYFASDGEVYVMHMGETLEQAIEETGALSTKELKSLGLSVKAE